MSLGSKLWQCCHTHTYRPKLQVLTVLWHSPQFTSLEEKELFLHKSLKDKPTNKIKSFWCLKGFWVVKEKNNTGRALWTLQWKTDYLTFALLWLLYTFFNHVRMGITTKSRAVSGWAFHGLRTHKAERVHHYESFVNSTCEITTAIANTQSELSSATAWRPDIKSNL